MGDRTSIEWTRGDDGTPGATWNPVTGCTKVSPGCDSCYAETMANRFAGTPGHYYERGFKVTLRPDKLDQPLRWRRPRRVFVSSMSDLFNDAIEDEYIARVFAVMALASRHTYMVLTKRHGRMRSLLSGRVTDPDAFIWKVKRAMWDWALPVLGEPASRGWNALDPNNWWPLRNVWLGVSVEDQRWADIRVPALIDTPAAVRFLSCEPLLGPVDLRAWPYLDLMEDGYPAIDWVIVGGESGRRARPMHPDWARSLRDQCRAALVPIYFKQAGSVLAREWRCTDRKGGDPNEWPEPFPREFPKNV